MGSIHVYDYEQHRWIPYDPDPEVWYQHFKNIRGGYVTPDQSGRYIIGSGNSQKRVQTLEAKLKEVNKKLKETEQKLEYAERHVVNTRMVTPVAQANAIAQSNLQRLRNSPPPKMRKTDIDWKKFTV